MTDRTTTGSAGRRGAWRRGAQGGFVQVLLLVLVMFGITTFGVVSFQSEILEREAKAAKVTPAALSQARKAIIDYAVNPPSPPFKFSGNVSIRPLYNVFNAHVVGTFNDDMMVPFRPGQLPCPDNVGDFQLVSPFAVSETGAGSLDVPDGLDSFNDLSLDGVSDPSFVLCSSRSRTDPLVTDSSFGRLPWREYNDYASFIRGAGSGDIRNANGDRLWYAASYNLLDTVRPLNNYKLTRVLDDWLSVDIVDHPHDPSGDTVTTTIDGLAAVVISPGVHEGQQEGYWDEYRPSLTERPSLGSPDASNPAFALDPDNQDGDRRFVHNAGNADATMDQVAYVHREEILDAFSRQDADPHLDGISQALSDFYERNRHLPDPATFESSNSEYIIRRFGRPSKGVNRHLYDSRPVDYATFPPPPGSPPGAPDIMVPLGANFFPPFDMEDFERLQGGRVQYEFSPAFMDGVNYDAEIGSSVRAVGLLPAGEVPAVYVPNWVAGRVSVQDGMGSAIGNFQLPPVSELFHENGEMSLPTSSGPVEWIAVIEANTPLQLAAPVHTSPERPTNLSSTGTRTISTLVTAPATVIMTTRIGPPFEIQVPATSTLVMVNIGRNTPPDQSVDQEFQYCIPIPAGTPVAPTGSPPACAPGATYPIQTGRRTIPFRVPFISNELTLATSAGRGDSNYRSFSGDFNALFADLRPGHAGNLAELGYDIRLPAGTFIKTTVAVTIFGSDRQISIFTPDPRMPAVFTRAIDTRHAFPIIPSDDAFFSYGVTRDLGDITVPGAVIPDLAVPAMTPIASGSQGLLPTPPLPNQIPFLNSAVAFNHYESDPYPFDEVLPIFGEYSAARGGTLPRPFGRAIGSPQYIDRTQHEVLMITDPNGAYGYFPAEVTMHPIFDRNINQPRNLDPDENAPREITSPARLRIIGSEGTDGEYLATVHPYPISDGESVIAPTRLTLEGKVTMPHDTTFYYPAGAMVPLGEQRFSHGATGRLFGFYNRNAPRSLRPPSQLYGTNTGPLPGRSAVAHLPPGAVIENVDVANGIILPDGSEQSGTEVRARLTLVNGGQLRYSQLLHHDDGDFSMVPQTWGQAGFRIESMGMGLVSPNDFPEPVGDTLYDLLLSYMTDQPVVERDRIVNFLGTDYVVCDVGRGISVPLPASYPVTPLPSGFIVWGGFDVGDDSTGLPLSTIASCTSPFRETISGAPTNPSQVVYGSRVRTNLTNDPHHNGFHVYPYHNMVVPMSRRMGPFARYDTASVTIQADIAGTTPVEMTLLSLTIRTPSFEPLNPADTVTVSFIDNPISRLDVRYQAVGDPDRLAVNNIALQPAPNRAALASVGFSAYALTDEMGVGVELDTSAAAIVPVDTAAATLTVGRVYPGASALGTDFTVRIVAQTIDIDLAEGGFLMQANPGRINLGAEPLELTLGIPGLLTTSTPDPLSVTVTIANSHVALNQFGNWESSTPLVAPFRPGAALANPGGLFAGSELTNVLVSVIRTSGNPDTYIDPNLAELAIRLNPTTDIAPYGDSYQDASLAPSDTMPLGSSLPDSLRAVFDFHTDAMMYESNDQPFRRLLVPKGSKAEFGMLPNPALVADITTFTSSSPFFATLGVYSDDFAPGGRVFRGVGFSPIPSGAPSDRDRREGLRFSRDQHSFTGPARVSVVWVDSANVDSGRSLIPWGRGFRYRRGNDMSQVVERNFVREVPEGFAVNNPRLLIPAGRDIDAGRHVTSLTASMGANDTDLVVSGMILDSDIVLVGDSVEWLHDGTFIDGPVAFISSDFGWVDPSNSLLIRGNEVPGDDPDLSFSFVANSEGYQVVSTVRGGSAVARRAGGTVTKGQIFRLRSASAYDPLGRLRAQSLIELSWSKRDNDWQHTDFRPDDLVFAQNNPLFYAVADECREDRAGVEDEDCASGAGEGLNALALPGAAVQLPESSPPLAGLIVHGYRGSWIVPPDIEVVDGSGLTQTVAGVQFTEGGGLRAMRRSSDVNAIEPFPGFASFGTPGQTVVIRPGPRGMQFLQEEPGLTQPYHLPEVKPDDPTARGHQEPVTVVLGGYTLGNEALSSYRVTARMAGTLHLGGGTELAVSEHDDVEAAGLAVSIDLGPGSSYVEGSDTYDLSDMRLVDEVTGFEVAVRGDAVRTGPGLSLPEVLPGSTFQRVVDLGEVPLNICANRQGVSAYPSPLNPAITNNPLTFDPAGPPYNPTGGYPGLTGIWTPFNFPCSLTGTDFVPPAPHPNAVTNYPLSTMTLTIPSTITVDTTYGAAGAQDPDTRFEVVTLAPGEVAKFDTPGYAWQGAIEARTDIGVRAQSQIFETTTGEGEEWWMALRDHNFETAALALDAVTIAGLSPVPNPAHSRALPLNMAIPHNKTHDDAWLADYTGTQYPLNNTDVTIALPVGPPVYCPFCGVPFTLTLQQLGGANSQIGDVDVEILLTNVASQFQIREGGNTWNNIEGFFDVNITVQIDGDDIEDLVNTSGSGTFNEFRVQATDSGYQRAWSTAAMLPSTASTDGFSGHQNRAFDDGGNPVDFGFDPGDHTPSDTEPSHTAFLRVIDYSGGALNSEARFTLPQLTGFTLQRFGDQVTTLTVGQHMDLFAPVAFYKQPGVGMWPATTRISVDVPASFDNHWTPSRRAPPDENLRIPLLATDASQLYIERRQLPLSEQQDIVDFRSFYPELTEGILTHADLERNPIFNEIEVEFSESDPVISGRNLWLQVPTPAVTIGAEILPGGSIVYPELGLALPSRRLEQTSGPEIVLTLGANGAVGNVVAGGGGGSPGIYTRPSAITTSVAISLGSSTTPYESINSGRVQYEVDGIGFRGGRIVTDTATPALGDYRLLTVRFAIPDELLPSGANFTSAVLDTRAMDSVFRNEDVEAADPSAFDPSNFAMDPQYEFAPHLHRIVFPANAEITLHRYFTDLTDPTEVDAQRSVTLFAGTTLDPHEPTSADAGFRPAMAYDVGGMVIDRRIEPAVTTPFADLTDTSRTQILGFNDDLTAMENPIYQNMWVRVLDDVELVLDAVTLTIPANSVINPLLGTYLPSSEVDIQHFSDNIRLNARSSVALYTGTEMEFAPPAARLPQGITIHIGGRPVRFTNIKALIGHSPEPLIEYAVCASADEVIEFSQQRELITRRNLLDVTYEFDGPGAADLLRLENALDSTPWGSDGPVDPQSTQVGDAHKCMLLDDPENTDLDDYFLFGNIHRSDGSGSPRAGVPGNDVFRMVGGRMSQQ